MNLPKPLGLPLLTAGLILAASTALAQPVRFNQADSDRSGFLSVGELEAALGSADLSETLLLSLDQDEDGQLSRDEVRAAAEQEDEGDDDEDGDEEVDDGEDDEDSQGGGFDRGEDGNHGHGNDEDGFDDDNPGRGHGKDGTRGGGRGSDNPGRGHDKND